MSIWSSHGRGRYAPAEADIVLLPKAFQHDGASPGVVYCHGAGADATAASDPTGRPGEWALVRGIAERLPVVVADLGGPFTFGNQTAVTRIDAARRYLQALWGARSGPVAIVAGSAGALAALHYAAGNRPQVSAVVGVMPVSDFRDHRTVAGGYYAELIATAWGLAPGQTLPASANPMNNVARLLGLPYQAWYASDDQVVPAGTVLELARLLGGEAIDVGPLGHTQAAVSAVNVPHVLAFLERQLAP